MLRPPNVAILFNSSIAWFCRFALKSQRRRQDGAAPRKSLFLLPLSRRKNSPSEVICSLDRCTLRVGHLFELNSAGGSMQSPPTSGGQTIRVLVADDTRIHTQLLADALRRDLQLEVISPPARSRDLVAVVKLHRVHVVVLSSNLDEEPLRGFELLRELRASNPDILAIMLLDSSKKETVLQAFRAGARGIFSRHDSVETLSKCIRSVYEGQIWANSQQLS